MGATQSVPVIGEIVTVADAAGRTVAAGIAAIAQQPEAAQKLIDSAGETFVNYSERSAITSNIRRAFADEKESERLLKVQGEAWTTLGESTPGVGHIVGVVRYATGDTEGGDRAMINATRTTAIIGATVATGGGALVAGAVAVGAAVAYDTVATGVQSGVKGEFKPVGYIEGVARAAETGDATDIYTAVSSPIADFAAGALAGRAKAAGVARAGEGAVGLAEIVRVPGQDAAEVAAQAAREAAAQEAARAAQAAADEAARAARELAEAEPRPVVPDTGDQMPVGNIPIGGIVKFSTPESALAYVRQDAQRACYNSLGNQPVKYDFVRVRGGEASGHIRLISHVDAKFLGTKYNNWKVNVKRLIDTLKKKPDGKVRPHLDNFEMGPTLRIGHTSLVQEGEEVIAGGEVHVSRTGVVTEVNSMSGHYRFPIDQLRRQIGRAWDGERFVNRFAPQQPNGAPAANANIPAANAHVPAVGVPAVHAQPLAPAVFGRAANPQPEGLHPDIRNRRLLQITATLFQITDKKADSYSSSTHRVHAVKFNLPYTLAVPTQEIAEQLYNDTEVNIPKVVTDSDGTVVRKNDVAGIDDLVDYAQLIEEFYSPIPDSHGPAQCFPQFLEILGQGDAQFADALPSIGHDSTGHKMYVGRVLADDKTSIIPCAINFQGKPFYEASLNGVKVTQTSDTPELLVNATEMEWIDLTTYKTSSRICVPMGLIADTQVGAVKRIVNGVPQLASWDVDKKPAPVFDSNGAMTGTDGIQVLCWKSVA